MAVRRHKAGRVRSAYFTATVSVSLVLFLLGTAGYFLLHMENGMHRVLEGVRMSVILEEGLTEAQTSAVRKVLEARPEIAEIRYVDKAKAAEEFREFTGEDILAFVDENPLPASFELVLAAPEEGGASPETLGETLKKTAGVSEIVYSKDVLDRLTASVHKIRLLTSGFAAALLLISVVLVNNAVSMVLFSRKRLIRTMQLVGATDGFISRPFLLRALSQGGTAAFVASLLLTLLIFGAGEFSSDLGFAAFDLRILASLYLFLFAAGMAICFLCTWAAVKKYIRVHNDDLHVS